MVARLFENSANSANSGAVLVRSSVRKVDTKNVYARFEQLL